MFRSFFLLAFLTSCATAVGSEPVEFDRDIRPILSDNCFACHGPDQQQRQADLRLDVDSDRLRELVGNPSAENALIVRVTSADPDLRMPPRETNKSLSERQINLLRRWIEQGGAYAGHWAWRTPTRPALPQIETETAEAVEAARNEIDLFVEAQRKRQGLRAVPPAGKGTLIRRVSFDLRGLPPTLEEQAAFLADGSPQAYERMVDRMLASQHYGERMAQDWLDLARYGDTNGYHADSDRDMWLYRDYVIDAFNHNKPFNDFIIENVAGDLIPNASLEDRIASGFNRNVTFNEEGGADPDEFFVAYAVDRANTTGQVFLGMTFGCAQCHDHKYDPLTQKEYYQFYAFFNSVQDEVGAGGASGYHNKPLPPLLKVTTPEHRERLAAAQHAAQEQQEKLAAEIERLSQPSSEFERALDDWIRQASELDSTRLAFAAPPALWLAADDINGNGVADRDESFTASATVSNWHDKSGNERDACATGNPQYVADALNRGPAVRLDGQSDFLRTESGGEALQGDFSMVVVLQHDHLQNHQMMLMWGVEQQGKRRAMWKLADSNMVGFNGHGADVVGTKPLVTDRPQIVVITQEAAEHRIQLYLDGEAAGEGRPTLNAFEAEPHNPITIGANNAGGEKTAARYGEVLVFDRVLSDFERQSITAQLATKYGIEAKVEPLPKNILAAVSIPANEWSDAQTLEIHEYFLREVYLPTRPSIRQLNADVAQAQQKVAELDAQIPTTMVMIQKEERNPAYVLMRGDFQNPGEEVQPDVPAIFPRLPADQPRNRLGLAYWLTDPQHPLVARVVVNRLWKQLFGAGLVKTLGDLGTQGDRPSHPDLLDWLAVEFIESGWDVKRLQKRMLMSATYRQSSQFSPVVTEVDPANRWLARASRFRLTAEELRDNALAISGLLSRRVGGASVKPYQPADYYADKIGRGWEQSTGESLYRRGVYTYWRRTTVYPSFQIFDAPSREFCTVNRPRTNTPLQALVLMNDPTFVEAARVFGQQIMQFGGESVSEKMEYAFRRAVARPPTSEERDVLATIYQQQQRIFLNDPDAAKQLVQIGETARPDHFDPVEHAAWSALGSVILNLDETVTRE